MVVCSFMNHNKAMRVMVMYGGVSPEHEVSVISGLQVAKALRRFGYYVMEVYLSKDGTWFLNRGSGFDVKTLIDMGKVQKNSKKILMTTNKIFPVWIEGLFGYSPLENQPDVVFPVLHGRSGEDGTLQGLLELNGLPYVGCGVTASGIKIDKYIGKKLAESLGISVTRDVLFIKGEKLNVDSVKFPAFVKPVGLGSSIGVQRVETKKDLREAVDVAFCYDRRVMVEEAIDSPIEVNISVVGNKDLEISITEQPVKIGDLLSFDDKYRGSSLEGMAGSKRYMPAKISRDKIKKIEEHAKSYFRLIGGKGIARVDFMMDKTGKIFFNEINTMPGSLAFYLWEKTGKNFGSLVSQLVQLALDEDKAKQKLITKFESNILETMSKSGVLMGDKIG